MLVSRLHSSSSGVCCKTHNEEGVSEGPGVFGERLVGRWSKHLRVGRVGDGVSSGRVRAVAAVVQHVGQAGALPGPQWRERLEVLQRRRRVGQAARRGVNTRLRRAPQLHVEGRRAKGRHGVVFPSLLVGARRGGVHGVGGGRRVAALLHGVEGLEVEGGGEMFERVATRGRAGEVREALQVVPRPVALLLVLVLQVLRGTVAQVHVGSVLDKERRAPVERRAVGGFQRAVGDGARHAGGVRLVRLLDVELGEHVLPAGLPGQLLGQLLGLVVTGVDEVEELRRYRRRRRRRRRKEKKSASELKETQQVSRDPNAGRQAV